MLFALVSMAHAAPLVECAQTWSARGVLDVVESADLNMSKMDTVGFLAARDTLLRRLECVNEPLSGPTVGAVHRVVATAAFLQKEEGRIAPALAGLLAANPGYQLPLNLYPEGHPIRELLSHGGILARDPSTRGLAALESGWLEVDGLALSAAPAARAAVIQQIDGQGAVVETRYVWPGDALGAWAAPAPTPSDKPAKVAKAPKVAPERPPKPEPPQRAAVERSSPAQELPPAPTTAARSGKARVPMLALTAASVVTTGVLYGLAYDGQQTFLDESNGLTDDELIALREKTNGLTIGWSVAGVASLGLGVGLAFAW